MSSVRGPFASFVVTILKCLAVVLIIIAALVLPELPSIVPMPG